MTSRIFFSFIRNDEELIAPIIQLLRSENYQIQKSGTDVLASQINADNFDVFIACIPNELFLDTGHPTSTELSRAIQANLPIIVILIGQNINQNIRVEVEKLLTASSNHHEFVAYERPNSQQNQLQVKAELLRTLSQWGIFPSTDTTGPAGSNKLMLAGIGALVIVLVLVGIFIAMSGGNSSELDGTAAALNSTTEDISTATDQLEPTDDTSTATDQPEPADASATPSPTTEIVPTFTPIVEGVPELHGNILYLVGGVLHVYESNTENVKSLTQNTSLFTSAVWGQTNVIRSVTEEGLIFNLDDFDGTEINMLEHGSGRVSDLVFSPDFSSYITISINNEQYEIVHHNSDLYGQHLFTTESEIVSPSWSSDGRQIVFAMTNDQGSRLYTLDVSGVGDPELLVTGSSNDSSPIWSPNNNVVWFLREQAGTNVIMRLDVDTSTLTSLDLSSSDYAPVDITISPDGNYLAFVGKDTSEAYDLFTVDKFGNHLQQLTNDGSRKDDPDWGN